MSHFSDLDLDRTVSGAADALDQAGYGDGAAIRESLPATPPSITFRKEICYDREPRDFAMYPDGEMVGFEPTYHRAEVTLDRLVFELMSGEYFRQAA